MRNNIHKVAAVAAVCLVAAACASTPAPVPAEDDYASDAYIRQPDRPLECVPYARQVSGIRLYGDAWTWWDKAAGRFARGYTPQSGSIMVLDGYAGPHRAHLAVVRAVMGPREIRIDHANWLDQGQIHLDDPVMDVSADNDWSVVRVFNLRTRAWGGRTYHVRGFIGPGPDQASPDDAEQLAASN